MGLVNVVVVLFDISSIDKSKNRSIRCRKNKRVKRARDNRVNLWQLRPKNEFRQLINGNEGRIFPREQTPLIP